MNEAISDARKVRHFTTITQIVLTVEPEAIDAFRTANLEISRQMVQGAGTVQFEIFEHTVVNGRCYRNRSVSICVFPRSRQHPELNR